MGKHEEHEEKSCKKCDKKCPNDECRCESLASFNEAIGRMSGSVYDGIARQPEAASKILESYFIAISTMACANCIEIDPCCIYKNTKALQDVYNTIKTQAQAQAPA